jgi:hypothetical protein
VPTSYPAEGASGAASIPSPLISRIRPHLRSKVVSKLLTCNWDPSFYFGSICQIIPFQYGDLVLDPFGPHRRGSRKVYHARERLRRDLCHDPHWHRRRFSGQLHRSREGRVVRPRRNFHRHHRRHHPLDRLSITQKKNLVTRKPCWSLGWVFITRPRTRARSRSARGPCIHFRPDRRRRERLKVKENGSKEKELPVHHKLEELLDQYLKATGLGEGAGIPFVPGHHRADRKSLCGNHPFGELASLPACRQTRSHRFPLAQRVLRTLPCSGHRYRRAPWPGCERHKSLSGRMTHRKPRQSSLSNPGLSDSLWLKLKL